MDDVTKEEIIREAIRNAKMDDQRKKTGSKDHGSKAGDIAGKGQAGKAPDDGSGTDHTGSADKNEPKEINDGTPVGNEASQENASENGDVTGVNKESETAEGREASEMVMDGEELTQENAEAPGEEAGTEADDGDGNPDTADGGKEGAAAGSKGGFFKRKDKEKKNKDKERIEELEDKVKRQLAEFENFRKRSEKEKSQMYDMGAKSVLEKILPVIDNFERGLATVPEEDAGGAFAQGMEMIYKQLLAELDKIGVKPIEAVGKEFDPNLHNAVMQTPSEEYESGFVAAEMQKGYMYHDTVIRHSMVGVVP